MAVGLKLNTFKRCTMNIPHSSQYNRQTVPNVKPVKDDIHNHLRKDHGKVNNTQLKDELEKWKQSR